MTVPLVLPFCSNGEKIYSRTISLIKICHGFISQIQYLLYTFEDLNHFLLCWGWLGCLFCIWTFYQVLKENESHICTLSQSYMGSYIMLVLSFSVFSLLCLTTVNILTHLISRYQLPLNEISTYQLGVEWWRVRRYSARPTLFWIDI
jgi:hypothetical protein